MLGNQRITITTGSMNRLESLRRSLATWLALPEVDEVIIVDWGSTPQLKCALGDFTDRRICIVRVNGQKHWQNSKCHNLEIHLAIRSDLLLRLDNDTLVSPDFIKRHPPRPRGFYAVNWRTVPKDVDDKRNLAGTLFIDPLYLLRVNGYNERLVHYGREDDDLHARLLIAGYQWHEVELLTVEHIPHPDASRFGNLAIGREVCKPDLADVCAEKIWGAKASPRSTLISMSERILAEHPWTTYDKMTKWAVYQVTERYWECWEKPGGQP